VHPNYFRFFVWNGDECLNSLGNLPNEPSFFRTGGPTSESCLRIILDLNEHTATSRVSDNGRYRIPNDNLFVSKPRARKEIWAYGLRNPHRLSWAIDPNNAPNNRLIGNSVGLHTWETVNIIHK